MRKAAESSSVEDLRCKDSWKYMNTPGVFLKEILADYSKTLYASFTSCPLVALLMSRTFSVAEGSFWARGRLWLADSEYICRRISRLWR